MRDLIESVARRSNHTLARRKSTVARMLQRKSGTNAIQLNASRRSAEMWRSCTVVHVIARQTHDAAWPRPVWDIVGRANHAFAPDVLQTRGCGRGCAPPCALNPGDAEHGAQSSRWVTARTADPAWRQHRRTNQFAGARTGRRIARGETPRRPRRRAGLRQRRRPLRARGRGGIRDRKVIERISCAADP